MIQGLGKFLKRLHQDTSGKMSVEMILLIGLIALPLILLLVLFRDKVKGYFLDQSKQLQDAGTPPAP